MGKSVQYKITDEELKNLTRVAAEAGATAYRNELEKARVQRKTIVLRNTNTLLKHYRSMKEVVSESVYDKETIKDKDFSELIHTLEDYHYNLDVESIKKSKVKTQIMIRHVETMLDVYRKQCEMSVDEEDKRRYRIIVNLFLGEKPMSRGEIAEMENIDESTVSRDIKNACQKLSVLIFGIHGINS